MLNGSRVNADPRAKIAFLSTSHEINRLGDDQADVRAPSRNIDFVKIAVGGGGHTRPEGDEQMPYHVWKDTSQFSALKADVFDQPEELVEHLRNVRNWNALKIAGAVKDLEQHGVHEHHTYERRLSSDMASLLTLQPKYENVSVTWRVAKDAYVDKIRTKHEEHQARLKEARRQIDSWVKRENAPNLKSTESD